MTIAEALRTSHTRLEKTLLYPETAWKESETLLAYVLQVDRAWLIAHAKDVLPMRPGKAFFDLVTRRERHEPLAYLMGSAEFCGSSFMVDQNVLIPRIETEEIVEMARRDSAGSKGSLVWDVGTGSGAIAISVKKTLPQANVIASDVSIKALKIAKQNAARLLSKDQQPLLFRGSLLSKEIKEYILAQKPTRLVVLANLPYLPLSDKTVLQKDVVEYEPASALFADEEGNALIVKLMKKLATFIKKNPLSLHIYFEFDPPQAITLCEKARTIFPEAMITLHKDHCGRQRFLEINR